MKSLRSLILVLASLCSTVCAAQGTAEDSELTPEQLDAAFTAEDAAREAARWSKVVPVRDERTALERITDEADLIFHGIVQSQDVVYEGNDIPFTHTTFAITDLVKGEVDGASFTLVQEGGPDKRTSHKVLLVSTSHYFATGEEELLFIDFDQDTDTHIVRQRFRVLQGAMYNENGRGVIVEQRTADNKTVLRLTPGRSTNKRFRTIPLGTSALYKQLGDDRQDADGVETPARTSMAGAESLGSSVGDFISAVTQSRGVEQ